MSPRIGSISGSRSRSRSRSKSGIIRRRRRGTGIGRLRRICYWAKSQRLHFVQRTTIHRDFKGLIQVFHSGETGVVAAHNDLQFCVFFVIFKSGPRRKVFIHCLQVLLGAAINFDMTAPQGDGLCQFRPIEIPSGTLDHGR